MKRGRLHTLESSGVVPSPRVKRKDRDRLRREWIAASVRKQEEAKQLLSAAKERLPRLKKLLAVVSGHWGYEDPVYRFYHQSFKVYHVQASTLQMVEELHALAPHLKFHACFQRIVEEGTGQQFDLSHNEDWLRHTRPILEAFFHARHFLKMVCQYAEQLDEPPTTLPSGWATVLCLFNLR